MENAVSARVGVQSENRSSPGVASPDPQPDRGGRARATRRRILDAAAGLFRENGYAAVAMRDVARATQMRAGSLYYHFPSREKLVIAVLDEGIIAVHRAVAEALSELPGSADPAMRFDAAVLGHLTALHAHSDYTSANVRIFGQVPEAVRAANLPVRRAYEGFWDALLADLCGRGALRQDVCAREARLLVLGALNATLEWYDPGRGCVTALARSYAAMLGAGILKPGEGAA